MIPVHNASIYAATYSPSNMLSSAPSSVYAESTANRVKLRMQLQKLLSSIVSTPIPRHPLPPVFLALVSDCACYLESRLGLRAWSTTEVAEQMADPTIEGLVANACEDYETDAPLAANTVNDRIISPAPVGISSSSASQASVSSPAHSASQPSPLLAHPPPVHLEAVAHSPKMVPAPLNPLSGAPMSMGYVLDSPPPLEGSPPPLETMEVIQRQNSKQTVSSDASVTDMPPSFTMGAVSVPGPFPLPARCVLLQSGSVCGTTADEGASVFDIPFTKQQSLHSAWLVVKWCAALVSEEGGLSFRAGSFQSLTHQRIAQRIIDKFSSRQLITVEEQKHLVWCAIINATVIVLFFDDAQIADTVRLRMELPAVQATGITCKGTIPAQANTHLALAQLPFPSVSNAPTTQLLRSPGGQSTILSRSSSGVPHLGLPPPVPSQGEVSRFSSLIGEPFDSDPQTWAVAICGGTPAGQHVSAQQPLEQLLVAPSDRERVAVVQAHCFNTACDTAIDAMSSRNVTTAPMQYAVASFEILLSRYLLTSEQIRELEWVRPYQADPRHKFEYFAMSFTTAATCRQFIEKVALTSKCGILRAGTFGALAGVPDPVHPIFQTNNAQSSIRVSSRTSSRGSSPPSAMRDLASSAGTAVVPVPAAGFSENRRHTRPNRPLTSNRAPSSYIFHFDDSVLPGLHVNEGQLSTGLQVVQSDTHSQELLRNRMIMVVNLPPTGRPSSDAEWLALLQEVCSELDRQHIVRHSAGELDWIAPLVDDSIDAALDMKLIRLVVQAHPGKKSPRLMMNRLAKSSLQWRFQPYVEYLVHQLQLLAPQNFSRICTYAFAIMGDEKEGTCSRGNCGRTHNCDDLDELIAMRKQHRIEQQQHQQQSPQRASSSNGSSRSSRSRSRSRERDIIRAAPLASVPS